MKKIALKNLCKKLSVQKYIADLLITPAGNSKESDRARGWVIWKSGATTAFQAIEVPGACIMHITIINDNNTLEIRKRLDS